mmetsp:Transcript_94007/g.208960  ORF Transcript_94007/g.208960 Transcript_94007/m.208960 type:complete len:85 (-) Transcript_94007:120-374(-)
MFRLLLDTDSAAWDPLGDDAEEMTRAHGTRSQASSIFLLLFLLMAPGPQQLLLAFGKCCSCDTASATARYALSLVGAATQLEEL